jgi:hypothetical protein
MADQGFRAALYWAPPADDPLFALGNSWLGRDPETGAAVGQPQVLQNYPDVTSNPCGYGFHATLRPPMRLATGWEEFLAAAEAVARQVPPFDLPPLVVDDMKGFLALRESVPCPALQELADACVRGTDVHRLAPSARELAGRRAAGLSAEQEAMLLAWGYPHVFGCWRFHMTLTRRLNAAEMAVLRPAAEAHFGGALGLGRRVREIVVFTQLGAAPFLVAERIRLGK